MAVWLMQELKFPISYMVGAKLPFGDSGSFNQNSEYFIYECDEFDRNFLAFHPYISLISGVGYDHADIYPTRKDYNQAFCDFISQSESAVIWQEDFERLGLQQNDHFHVLSNHAPEIEQLKLAGRVNRLDAWQVIQAVQPLTQKPTEELIAIMNRFPGVSRRFEKLGDNLYTDYAHTYEKIKGAIQVALEVNWNVVVVYEGLHNRRQHFMLDEGQFADVFEGVKKLYWIPSYLAREDPNQQLLSPQELIAHLLHPETAEPAELNQQLIDAINAHRSSGDLVMLISAGGGGSLNEWARKNLINA